MATLNDIETREAPVRWGLFFEAWTLRFKHTHSWSDLTWLVVLVTVAASVVSGVGQSQAIQAVLGHNSKTWADFVRVLPITLPISACMSALIWSISLGTYQFAFDQLRGESPSGSIVFVHFRRFPQFLLPGLLVQAIYLTAYQIALRLFPGPSVYIGSSIFETLASGLFLFVLPLMVVRNLSVRAAIVASIKTVGKRVVSYSFFNWFVQFCIYVVPVLLVSTLSQYCLPACVMVGGFIAVVYLFFAYPTLFITVALLYRDRFPETSN